MVNKKYYQKNTIKKMLAYTISKMIVYVYGQTVA